MPRGKGQGSPAFEPRPRGWAVSLRHTGPARSALASDTPSCLAGSLLSVWPGPFSRPPDGGARSGPRCFSPSLRVVPVASSEPGLPPLGASSELRLPRPSPAPCLIASCSPLARCSPACPHIPRLSQALPPVHILFAWRNPVRFLLHAASPDGPEHSSLPAWLPSGFVMHHLMSQSHRSRTCSLGGPAWMAGVRGTF